MIPGRRRSGRWLAAGFAVWVAGAVAATNPPGHAFPVATLEGARHDLLELVDDGRWTLVLFWTLDCGPCEAQKPMLERFHLDHFAAGKAGVVGVALDGPAASDAIRERVARNGTSFPTRVAFDDVFAELYAAIADMPFRATPTYWLFDTTGRLVGTHVGPITRDALDAAVAGKP